MKPFYTILLVAVAIFAFSPKSTVCAQTSVDHTFAVHLGTFVKAQASDFDNIRPLGFIYAEKFRNNLMQIYMGEFPNENSANQLLTQVKAKGYPDAYITRRHLQQGEKAYVLHLDTKDVSEAINWQQYLTAGPLYAVLEGRQIKVMTGAFENAEEANQRLNIVRQLGYANATAAPINNIYLHQITPFEAGGKLVAPDDDFFIVEAPVVEPPLEERPPEIVTIEEVTPPVVAKPTPASSTKKEEVIVETPVKDPTPPAVEMIPESYDEVLTSRSPIVEQPVRIAEPSIRPKVKRTSAIELQKVLKMEGTYSGSLDGYYGKGTNAGYAKFLSAHPYLRKYKLLASQEEQWAAKGGSKKDDEFTNWESFQLLNVIANEMDPNPAISQSMLKEYANIRSQILEAPKALGKEEQKAIVDWNTSLWKGLDNWTTKDPIHKKMTIPLKASYYQSMVLLEDYFMDKKIKPLEAKGLALSVLQTMVAPYLESYRM